MKHLLFPKRALVFLSLIFFVFACPSAGNARIGWISDIHAGSEKKEKRTETNIVYPKKSAKNFKFYLKKMKKMGISTVVVTGDITHKGKKKYAKKLLAHSVKYGIRVLWVKGNHDGGSVMSALGSDDYYAVEMEEWKIIVLDTYPDSTPICKAVGCPDAGQLEWLRSQLETDKKVLVAMHHPAYDENGNLLPAYEEFEGIIENKADLVISGHLHREVSFVMNGIEHRTAKNFSNKDSKYYFLDVD